MAYLLWHYLRDSARRHPDAPALRWKDHTTTYADLELQTDRLAAMLRDAGLTAGTRLGLYLPKSDRTVAAMLAASKTGAAYVPVDPGAPPARAAFILNDCAVTGLVTTGGRLRALGDAVRSLCDLRFVVIADDEPGRQGPAPRVLPWDDQRHYGGALRPCDAIESDPAFLLYTSGSTGTPKGVIITHRNAMTFVDWAAVKFELAPGDRLANHAPMHFDLSVFDVYGALRSGACTAIVPDALAPFPSELATWIEASAITVWYSVPSALIRLLLHGRLERFAFEALRTVLFAGEVFPVKYLRAVMERFARATFANLYGPTETNVCTYYIVPRPLAPAVADIPIGRPCENTQVFAQTPDGRCAVAGEEGELLVRGPSVTPGYWRLPERTAAVLQPNPLQPAWHEQVYRTGDIVRRAGADEYVFVGRRDHMIKSRGYRIELGEIEQVLYQHEHVKEVAVIAVHDEEVGARLHAAVAPHEGRELDAAQLHAFCLARLPAYMVPERFTIHRELPRTSTGKADRQGLLELANRSREDAAP